MSSASRSVAPPRAPTPPSLPPSLKFGSEACSEGDSTRTLSMSKKVNARERVLKLDSRLLDLGPNPSRTGTELFRT